MGCSCVPPHALYSTAEALRMVPATLGSEQQVLDWLGGAVGQALSISTVSPSLLHCQPLMSQMT